MITYKEQQKNHTIPEFIDTVGVGMVDLAIASITESKKANQRNQILSLLKERPCNCHDFMKAGIAQYNARIKELRDIYGHDVVFEYEKGKMFVLRK